MSTHKFAARLDGSAESTMLVSKKSSSLESSFLILYFLATSWAGEQQRIGESSYRFRVFYINNRHVMVEIGTSMGEDVCPGILVHPILVLGICFYSAVPGMMVLREGERWSPLLSPVVPGFVARWMVTVPHLYIYHGITIVRLSFCSFTPFYFISMTLSSSSQGDSEPKCCCLNNTRSRWPEAKNLKKNKTKKQKGQ